MSMITLSIVLSFLMAMYTFMTNMNHILNSLIALEFMALAMFFFMNIYSMLLSKDSMTLIYLLVMMVSESALALSILIVITYNFASNKFSLINLTTW